jgi:2-hydroxycyclohexanecarboxyl-CoA dehydrogenase
MKADLSGKVALVTGSTQGIGRAIAIKFAENGADVVVHGIGPTTELTKEIEGLGRRSIYERADLLNYREMKQMVDHVLQMWGNIDILVASGAVAPREAGRQLIRFFHQIEPELYTKCWEGMMLGRLYAIRAVLDHFIERQRGKIIIMTTDAARTPTIGESLISAAAGGLVILTKTLAQEFARWNIHINTMCATLVMDTPSAEEALAFPETGKMFQKMTERAPFWPVTTKDFAELALFLASEDSDRITGQLFSVTGGLSFPG